MKNPPRSLRARPLLLAGLSASLMGCPPSGPFGNLMAPPVTDMSTVAPDGPLGNLMVPPPDMPSDQDGGVGDAGDGGGDSAPFGNLMVPPPDLAQGKG